MRIGAKLDTVGWHIDAEALIGRAILLENLGVDSLWVSDHITQPRTISSDYPFAKDGRATWSSEVPYFDALTCLTMAASATKQVHLGTAVFLLPLRNPISLAKQLASLDALSGGRLEFGVGAGWMAEEFAALNVPFSERGKILDQWVTLLRSCWTGFPEAFEGTNYRMPGDMVMLPCPENGIPILFGGMSKRALARVGKTGDGWIGQITSDEVTPEDLRNSIEVIRKNAALNGREAADIKLVLRVTGSTEALSNADIAELVALSIDEIILDFSADPTVAEDEFRRITAAGATVGADERNPHLG